MPEQCPSVRGSTKKAKAITLQTSRTAVFS
jgi:hypothetical protein